MALKLDWETRSDVDLIKHGAYRYTESPHTDALLCSYRIDDGPLRRWKRGEPCPDDIRAYVEAGGEIKAHNAAFERLIWWRIMHARHGWPKPQLEKFRCTAVAAAAMSLPRSLDRLGVALDLDVKKDAKGKKLIKKHSLPQGFDPAGNPIWNEDPESLEQFHDYCDTDVLTEEAADRRLIPLSDQEQAVYALNERINDRGLRIDVKSARAALQIAEKAKQKINQELSLLTGGYVTAVTQVTNMAKWIKAQGVEMPGLDKDTVEEYLHEIDDLPERVRQVLELRLEGAKPSVEKIAAMLDRVSSDGRARGVYLHHGAGQTGRFSSRGVQAHNMPKYRKIFEEAHPRLDVLFQAIRTGDPDVLTWLYGPELGRALHILSDAVRSFIWAAPGHRFINADYTSIEGVLSAWFANEEWKLQAFRDLIAGTGPGMYELFAARGIYNVPVEQITKPQRGVGKVGELSMGYQGGVGALAKMARQNKLKLHTVFDSVWASADEERRERAVKRYEGELQKQTPWAVKLGREGWLAAELIKVGWRAAHPEIVKAWAALEAAAVEAIREPGTVSTTLFGRVAYVVKHGFLWCRLPSGRALAYGAPKLHEQFWIRRDGMDASETADRAQMDALTKEGVKFEVESEAKPKITALGTDAQTEKWVRYSPYGGSFFNNVVQGSARDILVNGMFNAEAAGYPIVLHTHDECMAEVPNDFGSVAEFEKIVNRLPDWCLDLPLKSSGFSSKRYKKD